jgi:hypothetical protein
LIRGYEDGKARDINVDWTSLSRLDGTLLCYAGPQQIPDRQPAHRPRRPPDESAAVVSTARCRHRSRSSDRWLKSATS